MLIDIVILLVVLWLIGFVAFPVLGWFVHILLLLAVIVLLIRFIRGK